MSPRITLAAATALLCLLPGCGKKDAATPAGAATPAAPAASTSAVTTAADGTRVVQITALDTMKYDVTRIEVKPGELVRVVLTNGGVQPKAIMGHNFVLLKQGVDPMAFTSACIVAGAAKDYFAAERSADVLAHTKLLGPKEKAEVTFTAPAEPGEYTYLCTFPAHFQAGMKGVLVVR